MHTWAKRGLQTALVTGGLLMLGTGIASASENVNPDRPASDLDGQVSIPLDFHDNQIGTPLGQIDLPNVHHTIATPDVGGTLNSASASLPKPLAKPAQQVTTRVSHGSGAVSGTVGKVVNEAQAVAATSPVGTGTLPTGQLPLATGGTAHPMAAAPGGDPLRGNTITGDIVAPVEVSGNAIALGGPAHAQSTSDQHYANPNPVDTGSVGPLSGNVLGLDWSAPVQVTGNAVAVGSTASAQSDSSQSAQTGGDVATSGAGDFLSGNVLLGQLATPLQVNGNSVAGVGAAAAESQAESAALTDGSLRSDGDGGFLAGNVAGAPLALPASLSGNALSGPIGEAASVAGTASYAEAGSADRIGRSGVPAYIDTTADNSILSGTTAAPTLSGPVQGNGNAGTLFGESAARGTSSSHDTAGGTLSTYARHSAGSGTVLNPVLATPVDGVSNAIAAGGQAAATSDNTVWSRAGDGSYSNGAGSFLSSDTVAGPIAYPVEAFGNAGALLGQAAAEPTNEITATAGGYNGTIGDDSFLSANAVETPLAGALEAFGDSVGGPLGTAVSGATEVKDVTSNGGTNTNDDNGVVSANLAQVAGSLPVQLFGDAVSAGGAATSTAQGTSNFEGGGSTGATGKSGFAAGNIAQVPVSLPGQVFGDAASAFGVGSAAARNETSSSAGGDALSTGQGGAIAGNVVSAPVAGVGQLFGDAVSVVGNGAANAGNRTASTAGGDVTTNGDGGAIAGNVVSAQLLPVVQGFGNTVGVIGNDQASGISDTAVASGGDIATSGFGGTLSGDILDFPVAFVGQLFGNGVGVLSNGVAHGDNALVGAAGGTDTSAGEQGSGSGIVSQHPLGFVGQIYDVEVPVLSNILASARNDSMVTVGNQAAQYVFPFDGGNVGGLPATSMPKLPNLAGLPVSTPVVTQDVTPAHAAHTPRAVAPLDGPVVPGANNLDLNVGDLPSLSGLDTAPLQRAFAELQDKAGHLGQQAGGLHSAGSLAPFVGELPAV